MLNDSTSPEPVFKDIYLRDAAPPHPGEVLRIDLLPLAGLTRVQLAKRLGITSHRLAAVMAETSPVTADLAMRLGALFGYGARYWLGLQMQHDQWLIEQPATFQIRPLDKKRSAKASAVTKPKSLGYR